MCHFSIKKTKKKNLFLFLKKIENIDFWVVAEPPPWEGGGHPP